MPGSYTHSQTVEPSVALLLNPVAPTHGPDSYSKEWANRQLRFGIRLLKGEICQQTFDRAIADCISIRWALANAGFWWQAKRLDNWIHRAKWKGDFLVSSDPKQAGLQPAQPRRLTHTPKGGWEMSS